MLTEMGEAYCHWSEPAYQTNNGNWKQRAEKMAHVPLMFTDELSHTDPDNGIRVVPYDSAVRHFSIQLIQDIYSVRALLGQL